MKKSKKNGSGNRTRSSFGKMFLSGEQLPWDILPPDRCFFLYSYTIDVKEQGKINNFLNHLDDSGVAKQSTFGSFINEYKRKGLPKLHNLLMRFLDSPFFIIHQLRFQSCQALLHVFFCQQLSDTSF